MISLSEFVDDQPWQPKEAPFAELSIPNQIDGVRLRRLTGQRDKRGELTVLLSNLHEPAVSTPHVYHVLAEARSVRAWVIHRIQTDRLAYFNGDFRVVLYDARPASPTFGQLNVLDVGAANPALVTIPPEVVHGVQNRSDRAHYFVNMPTHAYDPARPDKARVPKSHPGIPYVFE